MSATTEQPLTKQCTQCGEIKALTEFNKRKNGVFGLRSDCKICSRIRNASYVDSDPQRSKRQQAKYRSKNKEAIKLRKAARYAANPERDKAKATLWYINNPEKARLTRQRRYAYKKAMREFFKMHRAMHAIAETLNQMKQ